MTNIFYKGAVGFLGLAIISFVLAATGVVSWGWTALTYTFSASALCGAALMLIKIFSKDS